MPETTTPEGVTPPTPPLPSRTAVDIQRDYSTVCQRIGDLTYRRFAMQSEIDELNQQAKSLNDETARLNAPRAPETK